VWLSFHISTSTFSTIGDPYVIKAPGMQAGDFCLTLMLSRHHSMTLSLAPASVSYPSPVPWNSTGAFEECKASLSRATLLAHPDPTAPPVLVTDTSNSAMGAILQQWVDNVWQPLTFSKKLNLAQMKFSACDRELLAIY
jgi:hypothetical protein